MLAEEDSAATADPPDVSEVAVTDGATTSPPDVGEEPTCTKGGHDARCDFDTDCCSDHCSSAGRCERSPEGAGCADVSDCGAEPCWGGVCVGYPLGAACVWPNDCASDVCTDGTCTCADSSQGYAACWHDEDCCDSNDVCWKGYCTKPVGAPCVYSDDCMSRVCDAGFCRCSIVDLSPTGDSYFRGCLDDADCCTGSCYGDICVAGKPGDACDSDRDCGTGRGYYGSECSADGECVCVSVGGMCVSDSDCCSSRCINGSCRVGYRGDACRRDADCGGDWERRTPCTNEGICGCAPDTGDCRTSDDCCGGVCDLVFGAKRCRGGPAPVPCVQLNQASQTGDDCCKGLVASAGPGSACCTIRGERCVWETDCCSLRCSDEGRCE